MRDEKEERKKQARSNKQTRQGNTAHPRQSLWNEPNIYSTSHKKLKYSTAGTERVRSRFARGSLEVRSWCGRHAQIGTVPVRCRCGAVRCACAAVIRGRHAHRIRVLTSVENYPLLCVVGEDHLDHDQISHLGHVNTRCATIRSQYRIAPRRLAL